MLIWVVFEFDMRIIQFDRLYHYSPHERDVGLIILIFRAWVVRPNWVTNETKSFIIVLAIEFSNTIQLSIQFLS